MKVLTFDCYNTLLDTSTTDTVLTNIAKSHNLDAQAPEFCETYYRIEHELMYAAEFRHLKEILALSVARALEKYKLASKREDAEALVDCYRSFQPFADVPDTLEALARHYTLCIMSNSDNDILDHNAKSLGVGFARLFTAEDMRCYKPTLHFFEQVHNFLELPGKDHTHVAAGFWWDIIPAKSLKWRRIWVNRRHRKGNDQYQPYTEIHDFRELLPSLLEKRR